jgi:hypothetical protein
MCTKSLIVYSHLHARCVDNVVARDISLAAEGKVIAALEIVKRFYVAISFDVNRQKNVAHV